MRRNQTQGARLGVVVGLVALTLVGITVGVTRASHNFPDVPDSVFYHDFVDFLVDNGITAGCGGGRYCGEDPVTRGQMAVFLKRGFDVMDAQLATLEQEQNAALGACPPDAVKVGPTCIDKYEASVWEVPPDNAELIRKIRLGTVARADLVAAGATQLGLRSGDLAETGCGRFADRCTHVYAVSIPDVMPARFLNWFQALAAARNAGKRLPTNQEWQAAALGTPDGSPCRVGASTPPPLFPPEPTGTPGCESDVGAFDMVGNVAEWVAEWVPRSNVAPGWGTFSNDVMALAGVETVTAFGPGALTRGGSVADLDPAWTGPFAVSGRTMPQTTFVDVGFRAAR